MRWICRCPARTINAGTAPGPLMPDRQLFILRMVTAGAVSVAAFGACSHS
jgi:hypothetical protein